jgi:hypothetical protein
MPTTIDTELPYTQQQWQTLNTERQQVIQAVAEHLSGEKLPKEPTDEILSETLNLLRPCKGCVPEEENDDTMKAIRRKLAAVYWTGVELASQELQRRGHHPSQDFNLTLIIDPDYEDYSLVVVVDEDRGRCHLHEGLKAWHFHFESLAEIADAILSIRNVLVTKVMETLAKKQEIFMVLQGGLVQEVVDCPSSLHVTVIDYDTEGVDDERLQKSPLNGQPCCINRF